MQHKQVLVKGRALAVAIAAVTIGLMGSVAHAGPSSAATGGSAGVNIVGGEEAAPGEFSAFMVSVQKRGEDGQWHHFCGGSVVDPMVILTAAHCLPRDQAPPQSVLDGIRVVSGIDRLSDTSKAQFRTVAEVRAHPKAKEGNGYDIGTIHLNRPLENVTPVNLPSPGTDALLRPGSKATVIGWGSTSGASYLPTDQLMRVDVPILDQDECSLSNGDLFNPDTDVCAGVRGKDSCQGDSGGPLVKTVGEGPTRKVYQIGVVSRGERCAEQGAPGIYTYPGAAAVQEGLGRSR